MKPESRIAALFLLCATCVAFEAGAASKCQQNETLVECWGRVKAAAANQQDQILKAQVTSQQVTELHAKPTGIQTSDTNLKSNTTDFLPLLTMSGLLGDNKDAGNNSSDDRGSVPSPQVRPERRLRDRGVAPLVAREERAPVEDVAL